MPLTSNTRSSAGSWTAKSGENVSHGLSVSMVNEFIVSPSPCTNPSDHKLPGAYSFSKTVTKNVYGSNGGYYFWGNPGDRKRVDNSIEGTYSSTYWNGFGNGGPSGYGTPEAYALERLAARNKAVNKILDKIRDSDVNLSTTVGEGRETLQMVAGIARSVTGPMAALKSAVHKSRKGGRVERSTRSTLVTVGGLQLAWSVGLAPLLSDCESLRKHVLAAEEFDVRYKVQSRGTCSHVWTSHPSEWEDFQNEISTWYQFGASYRVGDLHAFENWRAGLTLRPTLAWELTTLSFVVDYFVQIGNFLAALEASYLNNGIEFLHGYETTTEWKTSLYSHVHPDDPVDHGALWGYTDFHYDVRGSGYRHWVTKSRSRMTRLPTQAFPTIKLPSASTQLLNCAALLSMLLR